MYKMLACDLDGTLLDGFTDIPESNIFFMNAAMNNNIKVVLCSGRSPVSLKRYEEMFGIVSEGCYGIGLNGAIVYKCDTREIINEVLFERGIEEGLVNKLRQFDVTLLAYRAGDLYAESLSPLVSDYAEKSGVKVTVVNSLEDAGISFSKVLVKGEFDALSRACDYMKDHLGGKANMFFSADTILEFTGFGATKGRALAFLAKHIGIDIKDVIAVGDNENDVSMLMEAGLGVAVKNAKESIKRYADYVTEKTCAEGVLEEIVKNFIL